MSTDDKNLSASNAVPAWLNSGVPPAKPSVRSSGEPSVAVLGGAMPPLGDIPILTDVVAAAQPVLVPSPKGVSVSTFEEGWLFRGKASINGTCTIAGIYEGQILEVEGGEATVVVSPTGVLTGDIRAANVSIMGRYSGTLDASGGRVELHASSVISGHVRYGQLQVNGADLNATLERVANRGK
jgi:cytoskeletal protein CcmA (bactofilin family)